MKEKTYKVNGFGNFSWNYNWDSGVDCLSDPVETNEEFEESPMYLGKYVNQIFINEHGGSRNLDLLVLARDEDEAHFYARVFCDKYYPKFGLDD